MKSSSASDKCRCKCYSCGFWGDIYDILKIFHPLESFPEQQRRVRDLQKELTAMQGHDGSFPQGTLEARHKTTIAGNIWADYRDNDGFELSLQLAERCKAAGVTVDDVIDYDRKFHEWVAESDQRHFDECDDPDCDARVCRNARGLPPLTQDEIEQGRREREQAFAEQQARINKALKRVRSSYAN